VHIVPVGNDMKSNLVRYPPQRKHMFNEGLTAKRWRKSLAQDKKRAAEGGSQELNREASNEVAEPLSKNPEVWIPTAMTRNA